MADDLTGRLDSLSPAKRQLLLERLRRKTAEREPEATSPLTPVPRPPGGGMPLSFSQQQLWLIEQLAPGSPLYDIPAQMEAEGRLHAAALGAALAGVLQRHEALRTRFVRVEGEARQVVVPAPAFVLPLVDLSGLPEACRRPEALAVADRQRRRGFDLESGLLLRAVLLRLEPERHALLLDIHHIASDGLSVGVLVRELAALYEAAASGRPAALPDLPIQYADFAWHQRQRLQGEGLEEMLGYWRRRLADLPPPLPLPLDRPRPPVRSTEGRTIGLGSADLPVRFAPDLARLGERQGATLFITLLAGLQALLSRITGQPDVVVGTAVANRHRPEIEGLIGYFVNTLALRTRLDGDPSFLELLARARETAVGAFAHQEVPFEKLVEDLKPERDLSLTPLFQVALALEPAPMRTLTLPGVTLRALGDAGEGTVKFDLTFSAAEADGHLSLSASYPPALFDAATVRRLLGCYARLLAGAAARPETPLSALPLLSEAESHQLTREWNDTAVAATVEEELPVHLQVTALARRTPGAPAVLDRGAGPSPLTYGELEVRAGRLRRLLLDRGVGREDRVAICLGRSAEAVLSMQAILGVGAAFVSLDPAHPAERLAFMLEDSGAKVLLTRRPLLEALSPWPVVEAICLDEIDMEPGDAAASPVPVLPGNLCYVFYTSGSTGRPKGVAIEHRGLSNQVAWVRRAFGISPGDRATYLLGPAFDGTLFEIWPSLTAGACLEVIEDEVRLSPVALLDRLTASRITLSAMPTPLCEVLLTEIERRPRAVDGLALRVLGTGGDRLHRLPARPLPFRLFNLYGPTENSVTTTAAPVGDWSAAAAPPIGRPLDNVRVYVLDAGLRSVPAGVAGELCAAGAGLARGYLGRPDQTAERFVPDPLSGGPGERLYRTGDRVRLLADGQIEFLGRGDRQVKIRGFRVEPGEVEGVLAEHPAVRACAVVLDPEAPGGPQLLAYAEASNAGDITEELAAHLRRRLPAHMVPAAFVLLDALPVTANGKVDREALLRLRPRRQASAELLRNAAEEAVAAVWREVLGVPAVGPDDSFFDLGGHSLLLVRVHERLVQQFPRLEVLDLFRYPTVATLAAHLAPPESPAPPDRREDVPAPVIESRGDIAVIGMAGRFPGAWSVEELWRNLAGGVESIRLLSREELEQAGVAPEAASSPTYVPVSAAVDGSDLFDAGFFGFTPREAEATDPQHRLFLECAWQALENAGYDPAAYPGRIGVFGGSSLGGYGLSLHSNPEAVRRLGGMQAKLGIDRDFLATRVSYKLGLTGPSFTVQTACSTSLVAVHLACRSLLAGECEMALAGGVSIYSAGGGGYVYEEGSILSPDGHCRAFDAAGRGTVPGEGVGLVVLKRLADALADGDAIDAVIRGSAINNDGSHKVGYTAPAIEGQAAVIRAALAAAGVDPGTVTYVEAHGTGTPLGDPIEVAALRQAFGDAGNGGEGDRGCAIGSIKTNLGHLDCAAGVAGLIKTVLALRHGLIPPSLHFERPNPRIDFAGGRFYVNASLADWRVEGPRRAGVSSFGIGGTNAHAVLEEAPRLAPALVEQVEEGWHLLLLSARSGPALEQAATDLSVHLERHPDLDPADVAWTLQTGRRGFDHRRAVVCRSLEDARAALAAGASDRVLTGVRSADRPVAFLFPGQGSQRVDMARGLYAAQPAFRAEVDRAAEILCPHLDLDLRDLLFPVAERRDEAAALLDQTRFTQPALFVIEHALAQLWMSWGIEPWALLGHSIGEYVAACLAGVFTLEDALALVALRGRLVQDLPPGGMLGVPLPAGEVEALLGPLGPELSLAAVNAADRSVVAGPVAAVEDLRRRLAERGIEGRPLATSHAFHSAMMDPAVDALARAVAAVPLHPPRLPYLSNVTGTWITAEEATDPAYWGRHLRAPVRFAEGVRELLTRPGVLLETGPGETLGRLARREARLRPDGDDAPVIVATLPSTVTDLPEEAHLLRAAGRLWLVGARLDWRAVHGGQARRRVHLPTYPFARRRYWLEPGPAAAAAAPQQEAQGKRADPANWFYLPAWKRSLPPPVPRDGAGLPDGEVLVFLDSEGLGRVLATRLLAAGRSVATVEAGDLFASLGDGAFVLRPGEPGDYDALLDALPGAGGVSAIVHLWSFGGPAREDFEAAVDRAFYSPLFLAQALARRRASETRLDLWLVSSHLHDVTGSDPVLPLRSLLLGPARVIPLELPGVTCHSVDLDAAGRIDRAVDRVLAEMAAVSPEPASPPILAWRGRQRWVQGFEPVRLEGSGAAAPRLRPGGVYLITGGLGGVGHAVALWLARTAAAKLVLVGRTPLPPRERWDEVLASPGDDGPLARRLRRLRELEEAGAEVLVVQADVTDVAALARAQDLARERWGEGVRGVIHAAGVPGGGVIPRKDRQTAGAVLAPKVQGTLALASVFPPEEMDLFVLFSSLNSVIGAYGQVDYCAANAFLDAFAASRAGSVVSIGWDLWEEAGMAVETASPGLRRLTGLPSGVPVDHPLLDRRVPAGPGEDAYLTRFSASRHWVLDEHRIQGTPVLPGTAYLELVRAAFEQSTGSPLAEIRQATFLVPLAVPDGESRDVYTVLRRQEGGWSFRVASRLVVAGDVDGAPRWLEHALGEIGLPVAAGGAELPVLADLLAELPLDEAAPLPAGEGAAMRFGPRWSNLRRTAAGEGRALALLELPEELVSDLSGMGLHPALLDLATGFAQGLMSGIEDTYVPFAYTGLRMERPLPEAFYSHARRKDAGPAGEQLRFEVTLLDPDGRLLVRIEDFAFRRVGPRAAAPPAETLEMAGALPSPGPAVPVPSSGAGVGLTSAEGVEALRRILAEVLDGVDLPQVMVSVLDLPSRAAAASALTGERLLAELGRDAGSAPAGPRHGRPDLAIPYEAPRTEAERRLAEVWGDLLGIEDVGIHDDFFELGGDSVLGLRIVARAREHGLVLTPGQLFERPTIAGLAAGLEATTAEEAPAVVPAEAPPPAPEAGAYEPASFPDADVSQRDLEALLAQLGGT